jgi:hypothetical protein
VGGARWEVPETYARGHTLGSRTRNHYAQDAATAKESFEKKQNVIAYVAQR